MKKLSIDDYISSKIIILDGLIHRCYEPVQWSVNLFTPLVSGENYPEHRRELTLVFLWNLVSLFGGGFVCLLFIALWNSLGIASLCLLEKCYTLSIIAIASAALGNTQSIKLWCILNSVHFCILIKNHI